MDAAEALPDKHSAHLLLIDFAGQRSNHFVIRALTKEIEKRTLLEVQPPRVGQKLRWHKSRVGAYLSLNVAPIDFHAYAYGPQFEGFPRFA